MIQERRQRLSRDGRVVTPSDSGRAQTMLCVAGQEHSGSCVSRCESRCASNQRRTRPVF